MTPTQQTENQTTLTVAHNDYAKGLNSYAFFRIPDQASSEDLVQVTFLKTWRFLARGGKVDIMRAFLYNVLNGLIVDEYRKQKTLSLDLLREKGFEPSIDISKRLFNVLDGKTALLFINRLPEKYQRVMRMRYIQGLSLKEISLLTGQSINTVGVQVHRGLKKLRRLYGVA